MNKLENYLKKFYSAADLRSMANSGEPQILLPNYSINVLPLYDYDGELLNDDINELEQKLGASIEVNDYNDLVMNWDSSF